MLVLCRSRLSYRAVRAIGMAAFLATGSQCAATAAQAPMATAPPARVADAVPLTVGDAFRLAASQQPWASSRDARETEQRARAAVADSWLADSPSFGAGVKTGNRDGLREIEFEISAPIASPSRRAALLATARSESDTYRATIEQEKLKLAGLVREAFWGVQLAQADSNVALDEQLRAQQTALDADRRTQAGESARVETLQANASVHVARALYIDAEQRLEIARQTLRALLAGPGMLALADVAETRTVGRSEAVSEHPALKAAMQSTQLARARFNEAASFPNAAPSVSFTLANERTNNNASATTARVGVSIPFGGAQRAAPRIASAGAELAEAQAAAQWVRHQLEADIAIAQSTVEAIDRRIAALDSRTQLSNEIAELYAKAYRLGELDLATRLRAEGERASANRALSRARIELKQAHSRVNQSFGLLP
jgi:outer membrane protein, heavy metal efflux system